MTELRWNPLIKDWVIIAPKRQGRPVVSGEKCPFCPGSARIPENYEVYWFENDFPSLSQNPESIHSDSADAPAVCRHREAYGRCEVILYSPRHTESISRLPVEQIYRVVELWAERFRAFRADKKIKYVYIFENRGELVGATISHPHGQIYGYSHIPKRPMLEIEACEEHYRENNSCLICEILQNEINYRKRIIVENESFAAFVPYFSECPYGVYIVSKNHRNNIEELEACERIDLARILKKVTASLDALFNYAFPYMMCIQQGPVNSGDYGGNFHFHVEIYSPMRSEKSQKFNASGETGAWSHVNPAEPEEKAGELRKAYERFMEKGGFCDG
ncbi:MAG TPA: galactose-1-phosphate uridylyltransferase [Ruminiclostridium sp.]|nr:galactose-1-phosphate uridylyltransferase [Ruminiclostridium sp.]